MSVIDAHAPVVLEPADHVTTTTPPAAIVPLTHACLRRRRDLLARVAMLHCVRL